MIPKMIFRNYTDWFKCVSGTTDGKVQAGAEKQFEKMALILFCKICAGEN